jgi:hypothetical protein
MTTARRAAILLSFWCALSCFLEAQGKSDLKVVLERARVYVEQYEEQLGTLIGQEDYVQTAVWTSAGQPPEITGPIRGGGRREQRRLSSDFLLIRVGSTWLGVRNVLNLDGYPVKQEEEEFDAIFKDSPEAIVQRLKAIQQVNSRYNIGDFMRTINVPTFPLTFLRQANIARFRFEKANEKKIDNVKTWGVRFVETSHPALVRSLNGEDEYTHGTFWIDSETGTVRKVETFIQGRTSGQSYTVSVAITYRDNSKLGMLVPDTMQERYDTENHYIQCLAQYSNFRRFETDVKLDLDLK